MLFFALLLTWKDLSFQIKWPLVQHLARLAVTSYFFLCVLGLLAAAKQQLLPVFITTKMTLIGYRILILKKNSNGAWQDGCVRLQYWNISEPTAMWVYRATCRYKKQVLVEPVNCPPLCLCPSDTVPSGLVIHRIHNCNLAFPLLPQGRDGLERVRHQRPWTILMIISVQTQWAPWGRWGVEHLGNNVPSCHLFQ